MLKTPFRFAALAGLALVFSSAAPALADQPYAIDPSHTQILFDIYHFGFSDIHGAFRKFDAKIAFDPAKPEATTVDVDIDASSVDTLFEPRNDHLKSPDFFNVTKYPDITFKSTGVKVDGKTAKLTGNLTMLGVTKPVTLDVKLVDSAPSPFNPTAKVYGFEASGLIKRSDFGMTKYLPANGGRGIGDDVRFTVVSEVNNLPPMGPPPAAHN